MDAITNKYLEQRLLLLNSDYGAVKKTETESLLSRSFSFETYKMYITAIFTHVVGLLELCKTKIYDIDLRHSWGTSCPRPKCGPREYLISPASEFSLQVRAQHRVKTKLHDSRYLDSK